MTQTTGETELGSLVDVALVTVVEHEVEPATENCPVGH